MEESVQKQCIYMLIFPERNDSYVAIGRGIKRGRNLWRGESIMHTYRSQNSSLACNSRSSQNVKQCDHTEIGGS